MNIAEFCELPVMGILRGIEMRQIPQIIDTVISTGLKTIEITMNTPDASLLIGEAVKLSNDRLIIGAGTVLSLNDLNEAVKSGATFIVTPVYIESVQSYCVKNKIPIFCGALTPQEIFNAWSKGATMVKLFPAKTFGPKYLQEIKAPLDEIDIMACGGVTAENAEDYFKCGASAISFGASIFKTEWLENRQYHFIQAEIQKILNIAVNALNIPS